MIPPYGTDERLQADIAAHRYHAALRAKQFEEYDRMLASLPVRKLREPRVEKPPPPTPRCPICGEFATSGGATRWVDGKQCHRACLGD